MVPIALESAKEALYGGFFFFLASLWVYKMAAITYSPADTMLVLQHLHHAGNREHPSSNLEYIKQQQIINDNIEIK